MNKRNLALLISKHPLLRKLTEDKTMSKSIVARLIVEELLNENMETFETYQTGILSAKTKEEIQRIAQDLAKVTSSDDDNYGSLSQDEKSLLVKDLNAKLRELKTDPAAGKEITLTAEHKKIQRQLNAVLGALAKKPFYLKRSDGSYSEVVDIMFWPTSAVPFLKDKGLPQYDAPGLDNKIALQRGVEKMSNEKPLWNYVYKAKSHSWVFFIDPEKIQERLGTSRTYKVLNDVGIEQLIKAKIFLSVEKFEKLKGKTAVARQELDIEPIAKKFGEYEYFKPLNDEQKQVMFKFIALLKRNELFENLDGKTSLVQTLRDLGVKGISEMEVILQYMTEPEQQTIQGILSNVDTGVDKFLAMLKKAELAPVDKEPGKEKKPSTPMKGEPVAIDPEQTKAFVEAANALINDFYNQKYRKNQGIIVNNVIDAMKAFVEDADLALAFGRPPTDEPQEQEATSEEPKSIEEQEEQEVKADKDEMRNIRIGLRSFLSRVNKTNKYLTEFQKVAKDGSVLSDAYKKRFMDNLKEIQTAIYRLALVLNKILDNKEELNEKKESEIMKKWKEVQKLYDLTIKSVSSVKELLDTETPPDELDSTLTNDAYSALIDLAGHFPSVAPFGAGKTKRSEFSEYKTKFTNAIGQLKSDLQNVFNLIKTGEAGEESLQNARDGLRDFGDQIASIFGVPSRFKDAKVKPGDNKEPAVQEDPEAKKEPGEQSPKEEDFLSQLGTIITDSILGFLGDRISTSKKKQQIVKDIEAQKQLDEKTKQILSGVVKQYGLTKLQKTAKMTSEEMQLYIRLLVILEKKGEIKLKLNEIVIADNIEQAIVDNFEEQDQETLMNILKKDGVYQHLLSLGTDNFGEEGFETFDDEEKIKFSNIKDIKIQLISKKADIERIKKLLAKAEGIDGNEELVNKYYEAFLLWYLMLNEKEATSLQEVFIQKIPISIREKTTEEKYNKTLQKLKMNNEEYFNTIKDFHQALPSRTVQMFYQTFETVFEDEEINIAIDKTFINTFSKRLNFSKGKIAEDFGFVPDFIKEQLIANKLKPLIREMLNKGK